MSFFPSCLQMDSPVSTPAPPPLHFMTAVGNTEIASPCEQIMVRTRSVAVNTTDVALATEPECLGPCEPGTSVNLEGIVWQETEDGKCNPWVNLTGLRLFALIKLGTDKTALLGLECKQEAILSRLAHEYK